MNRRTVIIILTLITALVHLVLLNIGIYQDTGSIDLLFTLNGLGYLGLLYALFWTPGFLKGQRTLIHYAFMAFALVTIIAWVLVGARNAVGYGTKVVEAALIVALWQDLKAGS